MLLLHTAEREQNAADPAAGPPDVLVPGELLPGHRALYRDRRCHHLVWPQHSGLSDLWLPAPGTARPGSGISLDPAWSPNGTLVAFVKAPVAETVGDPDHAWFADHAIYVWNSRTDATRRIGKVDGSALPTWSGNGRDLMYESRDGLWLMPIATGEPVEIVHPLYPETARNSNVSPLASVSYYGQIPWQSQFSWWSPPRIAAARAVPASSMP